MKDISENEDVLYGNSEFISYLFESVVSGEKWVYFSLWRKLINIGKRTTASTEIEVIYFASEWHACVCAPLTCTVVWLLFTLCCIALMSSVNGINISSQSNWLPNRNIRHLFNAWDISYCHSFCLVLLSLFNGCVDMPLNWIAVKRSQIWLKLCRIIPRINWTTVLFSPF